MIKLRNMKSLPERGSVLVVWVSQGTISHAARMDKIMLLGFRLWAAHYVEPDGWLELPDVEEPDETKS